MLIVSSLLGFAFGVRDKTTTHKSLNEIVEVCSDHGSRSQYINCVYQKLEALGEQFQTGDLMSELEIIARDNPRFSANLTLCHDVSHAIGQYASKSGGEVGTALAQCSDICTAGCYHGVIEGYVATTGNLTNEVMGACRRDLFNTEKEHVACIHGLGHGVASLVGSDVRAALQKCDELPVNERQFCGSGVLMELYEPGSFDHAKLTYPDRILDLCDSFWGVYQVICEQTAGSHELARSGSYQKAIEVCEQLSGQTRKQCAIELGSHMYHAADWLDENGNNRCLRFGVEHHTACLSGIVAASNNADPQKTVAKNMCGEFPHELREICRQ